MSRFLGEDGLSLRCEKCNSWYCQVVVNHPIYPENFEFLCHKCGYTFEDKFEIQESKEVEDL